MSTRVHVLTCWLEGAGISSLAGLLNEDPRGVEDALRMELKAIQEEAAAGTDCTLRANFISTTKIKPLTKAEAVPEQGPAQKARPDNSSSRPRIQKVKNAAAALAESPARKSIARKMGEFAEFPEPLRHPLAIKQRALFLMLQTGPKDVAQLVAMAEEAGVQEQDLTKWVSNGLYGMLQKDVVIKPDAPGGKWRLA